MGKREVPEAVAEGGVASVRPPRLEEVVVEAVETAPAEGLS